MDNQAKVILHLSLIPQVGPATVAQLLAACARGTVFGNSLEILYRFTSADFMNYGRLNEATAGRLVSGLGCKRLFDEELALIDRHAITVSTIVDAAYPPILKAIHMPPLVLYSMGSGDASSRRQLAIVGARKGDQYGLAVLRTFIPEFVAAGYTIVSGGALGIDTMAHRLTLEAGGCTGAILGSGLLNPYPEENKELFRRIVNAGGYLMSSVPLRMEPLPKNFPARNRIIAGLARGCLVVQAAQKSGSLITAKYALDEGREVCAVPGRVDDPLSAGCHELISQGAAIASSATAVLSALGDAAEGVKRAATPVPQEVQRSIAAPVPAKPIAPRDQLYALCFNPISFDDLIEKSGFTPTTVQELLWSLMLEGKVSQSVLGLWRSA